MATIALQTKTTALELSNAKKATTEYHRNEEYEKKKAFTLFNYEQREIHKDKETKKKEDAKESKIKKVQERIQQVSSDMLRTNRINGGAFPNLGGTLQEVSHVIMFFIGLFFSANSPAIFALLVLVCESASRG